MFKYISKIFLLLLLFVLTLNSAYADSLFVDSTKQELGDTLYRSSSSFTNKPVVTKEQESLSIRAYFENGFDNEDRFIRFSYRLIIILFIIFIATFSFIIINRFIVEYFKRRKLKINDRIQELIAIYTSLDSTNQQEQLEIIDELKTMQKNPTARRIILKNILSVDLAFSGESSIQLQELYTSLDYLKSAKKRLKSETWSTRAKAIRELAQMGKEETKTEIRESLFHINPVLRLEAGVALLKLDKESPFSFLDVDRELTTWQQMNLMEFIRNNKSLKVPSFKKWLNSKQESIIEFSIKLISYYQQFDALEELTQLLKHANWKIRLATIKCLGSFEIEEVVPTLISCYKIEENDEVRIQCIKSIAVIGSEEALDFLEKVVISSIHDERLTAAIALREQGEIGVNRLKELLSKNDEELTKILRHALDENLYLIK